jgi:uncharacterized protein involved in exopolysaccharide biosynthesis
MQTLVSVPPEVGEEIDAVGIVALIWRRRVVVMVACFLCGLAAVALALLSPIYYQAEAVVAEAQNRDMSGGGGLESQLSGFAGIAGISLPSRASLSQQDAAILESRYLAEEFIKRNNILPLLSRKGGKPTTLWLAVKRFKEGIVSVRKDARRGVTTVGIEWTDAATAARWANGYVALANELIRRRALDESSRNISYLNDQLARTNDVELRRVIYNIIESETKTLMLANGRPEYAFAIIDPAVTPEVRDRPHRTLIVLVGLALGLAIGFAVSLVLEQVDRLQQRRRPTEGVGELSPVRSGS